MKNYLLGVIFLVLAFYLIWQQGTEQIDHAEKKSIYENNENNSVDQVTDLNLSNVSQVAKQTKELGTPLIDPIFGKPKELGEEKLITGLKPTCPSLSSLTTPEVFVQSNYINLND